MQHFTKANMDFLNLIPINHSGASVSRNCYHLRMTRKLHKTCYNGLIIAVIAFILMCHLRIMRWHINPCILKGIRYIHIYIRTSKFDMSAILTFQKKPLHTELDHDWLFTIQKEFLKNLFI